MCQKAGPRYRPRKEGRASFSVERKKKEGGSARLTLLDEKREVALVAGAGRGKGMSAVGMVPTADHLRESRSVAARCLLILKEGITREAPSAREGSRS